MIRSVDPVTGLIIRPNPAPFPFGPSTVARVLDAPLASTPDRLALVDGDRAWTYRELDEAVDATAGALASLGIKAGDRVAWSLPNCAELPIGFLACQRISAIWVGVNPKLAPQEHDYPLADAQVALVVSDEAEHRAHETITRSALAQLTTMGHVAPDIEVDPHAPAAIAYTSGTTGRPKGAVHSQHNLLWQGLASLAAQPPTEGERLGTPLSHTILNIMVLGPVSVFVRGTTSVILARTSAAEFAGDVARHRLTFTLVVPTMIHDLVHRGGVDPSSLASLEHMIIGGAGTPARLRREFAERFGVRPITSYGLSEAPAGLVRESATEPIDEITAAYAAAPVEIVVLDENDNPVAASETGEICARARSKGPWADAWTPMLGYWRRPGDTAKALHGGVLHTSDIGSIDGNGRVAVRGRLSELIVRGGANIYPAEVERVLLEHPDVETAAVVGVPDDRLGQQVAAAITTPDDASPHLSDLVRDHCVQLLAAYKVPDAIVVVSELPRNNMGKVRKSELVRLFE